MPYIDSLVRQRLDPDVEQLASWIRNPGELNYAITKLCLEVLDEANYEHYNAMIGVLECAKLEMYRRAVGPYEDGKIAANGDVYG